MADPFQKNEIEEFIGLFNEAWTQGHLEKLQKLLNENVIFVSPDLKSEIQGQKACIETIENYVNNAKTILFKVVDIKIHSWNNVAMISLDYYIEYEMSRKNFKETGKEFWTLMKEETRWTLAWRAMVSNQSN